MTKTQVGVCSCLTSLYFCSVLASRVSHASTVALLLRRAGSRSCRSAGGNVARLVSWAGEGWGGGEGGVCHAIQSGVEGLLEKEEGKHSVHNTDVIRPMLLCSEWWNIYVTCIMYVDDMHMIWKAMTHEELHTAHAYSNWHWHDWHFSYVNAAYSAVNQFKSFRFQSWKKKKRWYGNKTELVWNN